MSYWKQVDSISVLFSDEDEEIARLKWNYSNTSGNQFYYSVFPELIYSEGVLNADSREEAEWRLTVFINQKCNKIIRQACKIRDPLPNLHELYTRWDPDYSISAARMGKSVEELFNEK